MILGLPPGLSEVLRFERAQLCLIVDLRPQQAVAARMSDSGPTCPHCGLPLSRLQIAALVASICAATRKVRPRAQYLGIEHPAVPYPQLMHPPIARLPKD